MDGDEFTLGHERLDVYKCAIEFYALALEVMDRLASTKGNSAAVDQLQRASLSIPLNIAEGAGKPNGSLDQKRYYNTSRGSAME